MRVTATTRAREKGSTTPPLRASQGSDEQYWNTIAETDHELPSQQSDPNRSCVY